MTDINHFRAEVERLKALAVKSDEAIARQQQDLEEAADRAADCDILRAEVDTAAGMLREAKARNSTLTARVGQLEGLASNYLAAAAQVGGCGDGNCVVLRPTGMHTNGGCRCTHNMDRTRERGVSRLLMMAQHMARAAITQEVRDD